MTKPISILIVDDQAIVRRGLLVLFTHGDFQVVGEVKTGKIAVEMAKELLPDVVLIDPSPLGAKMIKAIRKIKLASPCSQVIILASFYREKYVLPALLAGAKSYVLKDIEPEQLISAVKRTVEGETVIDLQITEKMVHEVRFASQNPFSELSKRETEVLKSIANGLTNAEIASQLFISEKTVKGHVSNILSKLHMPDRTKAAVFAWKNGFMETGE